MNKRVMLVGNPNCGKTTIFNALTGANQRVGNWPGVTVEKMSGWFSLQGTQVEIVDLPGIYALGLPEHVAAKDAQITASVVATGEMDVIINVIDACQLERHLYLTSQLLELGKPLVIALNMMDIARERGIQIDSQALSRQLHCPVYVLEAHQSIGIEALQQAMSDNTPVPPVVAFKERMSGEMLRYFDTQQQQGMLENANPQLAAYLAYRGMEQPNLVIEDLDVLVADLRYRMVHEWVTLVQTKQSDVKEHLTAKVDKVVLHRFWALPIFFSLIFALFFLAIGVGGAFQSGFDLASKTLFVQTPEWLLGMVHAPAWVIELCAHGIGQALNTLLTFIPVLAVMYFLLSCLESSGYMARAAFVLDRLMRSLGLPGQAFVPMIVGFGCNVPAILAARTMKTERDRWLTVLMNPYMSCSARLAIYAVFVAAFFPTKGYLVIFSLYMVGIVMAVLTGFLLRRTVLPGEDAPLILELPAYHRPSLRRLCKDTGVRLRYFLRRAGRVILPVCVVLSALNSWTAVGHPSLLASVGQWLTPLFAPMGISADNWPAVVGLITGMLAKEVVIGTLSSLYAQLGHLTVVPVAVDFNFWGSLQQALLSVGDHLGQLFSGVGSLTTSPGGTMLAEYFVSPMAAYAYLLFVLLYIPCVSTMAAIRQEASRRLMWFSIIWSLVLAYGVAVVFYQVVTWSTASYHGIVYGIGVVILGLMVWMSPLRHRGPRAISVA